MCTLIGKSLQAHWIMPCFNKETHSAGVLRTKGMKIMTKEKRKYKVRDSYGENFRCVSSGYIPEAVCGIESMG